MKQTKQLCMGFLVFISILFLNNIVFGTTGKVVTDTLMLRKEMSTNSSILELISFGDKLEILETKNGWHKVSYNGKTGYVSAEYVKIDGNENKATSNESNTKNSGNNDSKKTKNEVQQENKETTQNAIKEEQEENNKENVVQNEDINQEEENKQESKEQINENIKVYGKLKQETIVYITPLINSYEVDRLKSGADIEIISKTNTWAYVKYEGSFGWVSLEKVEQNTIAEENKQDNAKSNEAEEEVVKTSESKDKESEASEKLYEKNKKAYIKEQVVNIRKSASQTAEKIMSLNQNTEVTIIGEEAEWYKIKVKNKEGYVLKSLLSDVKIEVTNRELEEPRKEEEVEKTDVAVDGTTGGKIASYAMQFLGCKYVYGATGPNTFDCSGFTQYVYKNFGYNLTRTASSQANEETKVSKDSLQPGDLIIFYNNSLSGIGHVGLYIGGGRFIHASSYSGLKCLVTGKTGNMVKVSDLTKGEYAKRYHSAVRIIK